MVMTRGTGTRKNRLAACCYTQRGGQRATCPETARRYTDDPQQSLGHRETGSRARARLARAVVPLGWFIGRFLTGTCFLCLTRPDPWRRPAIRFTGKTGTRTEGVHCGPCQVPEAEPMARCSGLFVISHNPYRQCSNVPLGPDCPRPRFRVMASYANIVVIKICTGYTPSGITTPMQTLCRPQRGRSGQSGGSMQN